MVKAWANIWFSGGEVGGTPFLLSPSDGFVDFPMLERVCVTPPVLTLWFA